MKHIVKFITENEVSDFFKKDVELYVDTNWNDIEIGVDKNL